MRALAVLIGASALLGGCVGIPPAVNPTVEVWNDQPTANTDVADMIIEKVVEQVFSLAGSALADSSAEPTKSESGCWFWCAHERGATPSRATAQPVAYQYTSYSARVTNTAQAPATKPTPRPAQIATSKPAAPKEHAPRQTTHTPVAKPSTPKPSKPAASSSKKTDKK